MTQTHVPRSTDQVAMSVSPAHVNQWLDSCKVFKVTNRSPSRSIWNQARVPTEDNTPCLRLTGAAMSPFLARQAFPPVLTEQANWGPVREQGVGIHHLQTATPFPRGAD